MQIIAFSGVISLATRSIRPLVAWSRLSSLSLSSSLHDQTADAASSSGWLAKVPPQKPEKAPQVGWFWTRRGPDGQVVPMQAWEKWYWGAGVGGLSLLLFPRIQKYTQKDDVEDQEREKKELEEKRLQTIPLMVSGKSFIEEEESKLFDGLSPSQINQLAKSSVLRGTGGGDDPYDGLSPEEIDALFAGGNTPPTNL